MFEVGEIVRVRILRRIVTNGIEEKRWKTGKIVKIYPNYYLIEFFGKYKEAYKVDEIKKIEGGCEKADE